MDKQEIKYRDGRYVGELQDDLPCGIGTLYNANNIKIYEGQWRDGKEHGNGSRFDIDTKSIRYKGHFIDGNETGFGALYSFGQKIEYAGEFLNSIRHGKGTEYDSNGSIIYDGNYANNIWHGYGVYCKKGETPRIGYWLNGYPVEEETYIIETCRHKLQGGTFPVSGTTQVQKAITKTTKAIRKRGGLIANKSDLPTHKQRIRNYSKGVNVNSVLGEVLAWATLASILAFIIVTITNRYRPFLLGFTIILMIATTIVAAMVMYKEKHGDLRAWQASKASWWAIMIIGFEGSLLTMLIIMLTNKDINMLIDKVMAGNANERVDDLTEETVKE